MQICAAGGNSPSDKLDRLYYIAFFEAWASQWAARPEEHVRPLPQCGFEYAQQLS